MKALPKQPGCSKLTMALVTVSLKFQTYKSNIRQYFVEKREKLLHCKSFTHFFSTKYFSVFGYKVVKHWTSWPLNELAKLTMLWTTGLRCLFSYPHWKEQQHLFYLFSISNYKTKLNRNQNTQLLFRWPYCLRPYTHGHNRQQWTVTNHTRSKALKWSV